MTSATVTGRAKPLGAYPHWKRIGDFVYVSGTSARQSDDTVRGSETDSDGNLRLEIRPQTEGVLENLRAILADAGAELSDLIDVTTFLVDMRDFQGYNEVYSQFFDADGPTRTTVAVAALPRPELLIEMKAVAYCPIRGRS